MLNTLKMENRVKLLFIISFLLIVCTIIVYFFRFQTKTGPLPPRFIDEKRQLYYVPADEGLFSKLHQTQTMWYNLNQQENSTTLVIENKWSWNNYHYPDLKAPISLCDIFELPSSIQCVTIGETKPSWCDNAPYLQYGEKGDEIRSNLDLKKIDCYKGVVNTDEKLDLNFPLFNFKEKYLTLLPLIKFALGLGSGSEYAVVHWRRRDKCTPGDGLPNCYTRSPNCATPSELVTSVHSLLTTATANTTSKEHLHNRPKRRGGGSGRRQRINKAFSSVQVLVATNERNDSTLNALESLGFKVLRNTTYPFVNLFSSLDLVVIEMMLMCDANYLIGWCYSEIHVFAEKCRRKFGGQTNFQTIIS